MIRDTLITFYLLCYKNFFNLFKLFPLKDKVTFVITFGDNSKYVYDEIKKQKRPVDIVVLYKGKSSFYFTPHNDVTLIPLDTFNIFDFFRRIFHLATSKYILIDNYFGFLAAIKFKRGVECIQLWHASGAIKKFGAEDISVDKRSKRAQERFFRVYKNFHKVIVGSDVMADIFMKAFNLSDKNILRTGIPRTDFFYNEEIQHNMIEKLIEGNPALKNKKKILYAPTYRDQQLDHFEMKLELDKMFDELGPDYIVLLRLHPAVKHVSNYSELYPGFVYDYSSSTYDINELLLISDYLITDYSSIPYEFSLLNKPMIFFAYDLDTYKKERGLWDDYEKMVPGPVVKKTTDIIHLMKENQFDLEQVRNYAGKWNKYSTGNSSEKLVKYMFEKDSFAVRARGHYK
ncbi:CDP-glycerol glycerophosphotransferase family protein [Lederbergia citrea]|uniref:CDP-glycerol glycerophosphotransferase family protein n=1 Tax=Lederbergia citrea TaxID=2833581 RepID=UPI001BCA1752|nr:CDP-glycerol glycerophosphotransferase family protein [Lederbergia citrea]MBS4178109.1 CDP-glycerol glycerophosphotransferase family protein [Lederbergia citrea]